MIPISLNIPVPKKIIQKLRRVKIMGDFVFDWRKEGFCHCTLKMLSVEEGLPDRVMLDAWVSEAKKVISRQAPFDISIRGVKRFPTVIYAEVHSETLKKLHRKLCAVALPSIQPYFEGKNFKPHISLVILGKYSDEDEIRVLSPLKTDFGSFEVNEVQLTSWMPEDEHQPQILHRFSVLC